MKIYKYLLMLPLALMAASCSDENKEALAEEEGTNQLKSVYARYGSLVWQPGETIKYFIKEDKHVEDDWIFDVYDCLDEVMDYANIIFEEVDNEEDAQAIIEFNAFGFGVFGYFVNYECEGISRRDVIKNGHVTLPIYGQCLTSAEVRHALLHEIGHLLGLQDELYNINCNLKLDESAISEAINQCLPKEDMPFSYLKFYNEYSWVKPYEALYCGDGRKAMNNTYQSGPFDRNSVMMSYIAAKWNLTDHKEIKEATSLSTGDKEKLMEIYPFNGNFVPIYAGSDPNVAYGGIGILGKFEDFSDKSKIRKKVGYGYKTNVAGTVPVYRYERKKSDGEIEVRYSWEKTVNGKVRRTNGVDDTFSRKARVAYVYDNVGYGKTPIEVYYGNQSRSYTGVSFCNDPYMKSRGNYAPGFWATVLTQRP